MFPMRILFMVSKRENMVTRADFPICSHKEKIGTKVMGPTLIKSSIQISLMCPAILKM